MGTVCSYEKRTNLYAERAIQGIKALGEELLAQNAEHKDLACTEEMMKLFTSACKCPLFTKLTC